jgi:hypothetical protein
MSYQQSGYAPSFGSNISFGSINLSTGTVGVYNSGAGSSAAHVMQTIDISSPSGSVGKIKITNNDSPAGGNPAGAHEYAPGMTEPGDVEYEVVYVKGKHETLMQMQGNGISYSWQESFPDGSICTFVAFVESATVEGKTEDSALMGKVKLTLCSPAVWT